MTSSSSSFTLEATWVPLPSATRGERVILSADPFAKSLVYCNSQCVIIRDLKNPEIAKTYNGHKCNATVARYSPSGNFVASGDERGQLQIWSPDHESMLMKYEYTVLSGKIRDIAWDSESKRLIAVGDGRNKFFHAFSLDTGTTIGNVPDHLKCVNTVSIRQTRPIRAATGSDDMAVGFHSGVPFKLMKLNRDVHTRFVNCVAFSPDNSLLASAALDGNVVVYDAVDGSKKFTVTAAHSGGIYGLSWSPDSKNLLTSSGDRSVKLWDVSSGLNSSPVVTWQMGSNLHDQQLGNVWAGDYKISVSLSGILNYLDEKTGQVSRRVDGHQTSIGGLYLDRQSNTLFTGSRDGKLCAWSESGEPTVISTTSGGHVASVSGIVPLNKNPKAVSYGSDCRVCTINLSERKVESMSVMPQIPFGAGATSDGSIYVGLKDGVFCVGKPEKLNGPSGEIIAVSSSDLLLACASDVSPIVRIYALPFVPESAPVLEIDSKLPGISALDFSADDKILAAAGTNGVAYCFSVENGERLYSMNGGHASRITRLNLSPSGTHCASSGVDTKVIVWRLGLKTSARTEISRSHHGTVSAATFCGDDETTVISAGSDGCIKKWKVTIAQP